ncbi:PREDICTED: growth-regulating factor 6-like isoform X2 [Nelumbo nucifera]|uniref:Growth-regulating factor n=1 Tax=Nelumbo nucifera TaxID=4432 RepID=A0A1U8BBH7_NELNU|nr:PREDICTED: growth-regulating factor 6-like isoform X2 [Nelumbo nucifera]
MDFGVVGLDSFMGSESGLASLVSESEAKQKGYGSGFLKQERSGTAEDDWRSFKMPRTDDLSASKTMLLQQRTPSLLRSNSLFADQPQQQMLSFSSPKSEGLLLSNDSVLAERNLQNAMLPYYHHPSSSYARSTGLSSGSLNASMHGVLTGVRGPFTPSQWMELEHQALIYKYITANAPIPSNLLIPLRKALNPSGFSGLSAGSLRPSTLGWGSFHLGFSGNTDPEPGRCRRTDGKKWRCSRDAVADQKYCERHMNRGRHRSRKPVEGQTGHAVPGPTTTKVMPSASASVVSSSGASNSVAITQHQMKSLNTGAVSPSTTTHINRILLNKEKFGDQVQDSQGMSVLSPSMNPKAKDFSVPKQQIPFEDSSRMEFGLVSSDSLLNPSQRSSYMNCRNFSSSPELNDREQQQPQHPLRHFIDDWPKNRSDRSGIAWPEVEEIHSDRTQLSISIPVASSEFSSSSSSPTHEKLTLSPLRLSREFDPIQMGLGVGSILNEPTQRQTNWIPISWETSMGGPLGEVLNNTNNSTGDCKNSSALNLMTEGWDGSPRLGSSPIGVLQKATFGSLSNSSSGSSPRVENKTHDGSSLCDDLLGSAFVNSSSIPSL